MEFVDRFFKHIEDKVRSLLFSYFFASILSWNWRIIYLSIFVDGQLLFDTTHQTKLTYIKEILSSAFLSSWISITFGDSYLPLFHFVLFPALIAISLLLLTLWPLQLLEKIFLKRFYKNIEENKTIKIESRKKDLEEKRIIFDLEKQVASEMTDEQKWQLEFQFLNESVNFHKYMSDLKSVIYGAHGWLSGNGFNLDSDSFAFLDANGLVVLEDDKRMVRITDKGRFFLRLYKE